MMYSSDYGTGYRSTAMPRLVLLDCAEPCHALISTPIRAERTHYPWEMGCDGMDEQSSREERGTLG